MGSTVEQQFYDRRFNAISDLTISFLCPGKVTVNCMKQKPNFTTLGSTVFPVKQWKFSNLSIKFFPITTI